MAAANRESRDSRADHAASPVEAAVPGPTPDAGWADALLAAALIAVDPVGLGGVALRARAGPVRDRWLAEWRALLPADTPVRRLPLHIGDDRLLGGLDLAATLRSGRPVAQSGLLTQCDGGALVVAMAERLGAGQAARLAAAMDRGELQAEREGLPLQGPACWALIALDEGDADDEHLPAVLGERMAFALRLDGLPWRAVEPLASTVSAQEVMRARARLGEVAFDGATVEGLCGVALALGVHSSRAAWLAWRAARAAAALRGSRTVDADDAVLAARLVLAPRATQLPVPPEPKPEPEPESESEAAPAPPEPPEPATSEAQPEDPAPPPPADETPADADPDREPPQPAAPLDEMLIEAALAAIPAGLLAALKLGQGARSSQAGRADAWSAAARGGRPVGSRRGDPRSGARLSLVDTLRAAAPWQALRRAQRGAEPTAAGRRIEVQADDFRVARCRQRRSTTTLFVIDASGSSALHRLAEAKGAVNLLLADCYVRRDSVAVLAFRGRRAELLLPPTRSLVRAKRSLAALPGGGGTPLAAGIEAALALAAQVQRAGATPLLVFLTDGRANVALDGSGGRAQADSDALRAARRLRGAGLASLLIDTSPQPAAAAQRLAAAMAARYSALPHAGARALSQAVRSLQAGPARPAAARSGGG
ncbi:MAG: magnesium chelatase subunit D [Burkholderiales bacterium]|nr:magnesium chelatase subunit D [Burkholderiales bacterium]